MSHSSSVDRTKQKTTTQRRITIGLFIALSSLTFAFAVMGKSNLSTQPVSTRVPASQKIKALFHKKKSALPRTYKLENPLQVHIEKEGDLQIEAGEPFVLRGVFQFSSFTRQAKISWGLPKGISILQGQEKETFLDIPANTQRQVEVVLISETEENKKIHFKVGIGSGKQRFGFSAQYNTTMQESINVQKADLKLRSEEYNSKTKKRNSIQVFK